MSDAKNHKPNFDISATEREPVVLNCEQLEGFVVDYLENSLPVEQHEEFVKHLGQCPDCEQYIKNYQTTIRLTQSVFEEERDCAEDMPEALVRAILASRQKTNKSA